MYINLEVYFDIQMDVQLDVCVKVPRGRVSFKPRVQAAQTRDGDAASAVRKKEGKSVAQAVPPTAHCTHGNKILGAQATTLSTDDDDPHLQRQIHFFRAAAKYLMFRLALVC